MDVGLVTSREWAQLTDSDRLLHEALTRRGLEVAAVVWDDPEVDWAAIDVAVIRSTWDYFLRRDEFVAWAERAGELTDLHNRPDVVRWNTHKGYLVELEDRGVPVVPTAWMAHGDRIDLEELRVSRGWGDVVLKPAVSAGAHLTHRVTATDPSGQAQLDELLAQGDVLAQPYLRGIERGGELSLMFADGRFTHGVHKLPAQGDFRVQEQFAGRTRPWDHDPEVRDLAAWILEATGHEFLYARVDLVPDDGGAWQLAELEVVEPSLYLEMAPHAPDAFAEAVARRC